MRPIKLTMSAFGPFSGIEVIEFERLGENPLFLINGPTGSGKTTILDGICFALYGKTTGNEREAAEMRCDTAAPETLSYVELIFSLGGKTWRIRREPEQLRPKGRGEGLTAHQPRAELYGRDESGKESVRVASKVTEARAAIEELTGLNVEQFRQVMVLPQGEFRNLLMAKSSDREKVFSHLFQTQIYTRIEFALKEQAAGVRKNLEASRNQQLGVLRGAGVESEEQLLRELESQAGQMKESAAHKTRAAKSRKQAERALINAQKLAADFERLGQAKAALQMRVQQSKEVDELDAQLHRARAALRLQPEFNQWQLAIKQRERSELNLGKVQGKLQASLEQLTLARDKLQGLVAHEPEIESIQQHKRDLEAYRNRVGQFEAAVRSLETGARELTLRKTALDECRSQWQKNQFSSEDINQQHRRILERLKGLAEQQLELRRLEDRYQQRKSAEETDKKLDDCKSELRELAKARNKAFRQRDLAEQAVVQLELAWHTGQAVILAEKLQKDQPCPVCGSFDHPQLASSELEIPGDQARREAASCLAGANEILLKLDTEIAGQEVRKAHLIELVEAQKTTLGDLFDRPVAELLNTLNGQQQRVQSLKDDQLKESQLADELQRLSSELIRF
ncbi:MAG: SMC family ATPase, partial [Proteobacteria bacterium]|nr:SMC family ATPase [Pseudomonadota bacterium]